MSRTHIAVVLLCAIIAFLISSKNWLTVTSLLLYLLFLLCPLLHLFMHRKHEGCSKEEIPHGS
jgi:uncharacterized membrane protein YhaH (DUF805 family)